MESAATPVHRRDDEENGEPAAAVAAVKRARPVGGGGRGAGYSAPEVSFFLSLLEEHLPVTHKEWRAVSRLHNTQFPSLKRTPNSLRRKFTALCRLFTGGDEAVIAPDVRRAVNVKRRMKNRGDVPDEDEESEPDSMEGDMDDESVNGAQRRRESTGETVSVPVAAGAPQPAVAINPRYYPMNANPPPTQAVTVAAPMATVAPAPPSSTPSRAQAIYDRVAEAADRRGGPSNGATTSATELLELIKLQLLQNVEDDRRRRAEELERREEERRNREEERAIREEYRRRWEEERARRQEDLRRWEQEREESRRRHDDYMQLILSLLAKK